MTFHYGAIFYDDGGTITFITTTITTSTAPVIITIITMTTITNTFIFVASTPTPITTTITFDAIDVPKVNLNISYSMQARTTLDEFKVMSKTMFILIKMIQKTMLTTMTLR